MHTCTLAPLPRLPFFNLLPFHTHSNTHTYTFFLTFPIHRTHFNTTPISPVPSYCCIATAIEWMWERVEAMNVSVCVWGIFHIAFYFESKESWGSEATLFFHERDRVFSELPPRQTEKKEKEMSREIGNEQRRNGGRKRRRASGRETKSGV